MKEIQILQVIQEKIKSIKLFIQTRIQKNKLINLEKENAILKLKQQILKEKNANKKQIIVNKTEKIKEIKNDVLILQNEEKQRKLLQQKLLLQNHNILSITKIKDFIIKHPFEFLSVLVIVPMILGIIILNLDLSKYHIQDYDLLKIRTYYVGLACIFFIFTFIFFTKIVISKIIKTKCIISNIFAFFCFFINLYLVLFYYSSNLMITNFILKDEKYAVPLFSILNLSILYKYYKSDEKSLFWEKVNNIPDSKKFKKRIKKIFKKNRNPKTKIRRILCFKNFFRSFKLLYILMFGFCGLFLITSTFKSTIDIKNISTFIKNNWLVMVLLISSYTYIEIKKNYTFDIIFLIIICVIFINTYTKDIYTIIPENLGGGSQKTLKYKLNNVDEEQNVILINSTNDFFYVVDNHDDTKIQIIPKSDIKEFFVSYKENDLILFPSIEEKIRKELSMDFPSEKFEKAKKLYNEQDYYNSFSEFKKLAKDGRYRRFPELWYYYGCSAIKLNKVEDIKKAFIFAKRFSPMTEIYKDSPNTYLKILCNTTIEYYLNNALYEDAANELLFFLYHCNEETDFLYELFENKGLESEYNDIINKFNIEKN